MIPSNIASTRRTIVILSAFGWQVTPFRAWALLKESVMDRRRNEKGQVLHCNAQDVLMKCARDVNGDKV